MGNLTGRKLGKYELAQRLAQGGMAEVYKAFQPGVDRWVVVKVLHYHLAIQATLSNASGARRGGRQLAPSQYCAHHRRWRR